MPACRRHDRYLTCLDAKIEAGERQHDASPIVADAEIAQRAGESESVHEAERERQLPARRAGIAHQVLDPDEDNRRRDERLDDRRWSRDQPENGQGQRHGVGECERRHRRDHAPQPAHAEQERHQEQQVIVAGEYVAKAQPEELPRRLTTSSDRRELDGDAAGLRIEQPL